MASLYDIPVTTLDGRETTMNDWAGHVLLIVNTASKCGLTGQYEGLQRIFDDYAMRGFFVIGMPCNQFGEQEPGTADEISDFCSVNYGVSFKNAYRGWVFSPLTSAFASSGKDTP